MNQELEKATLWVATNKLSSNVGKLINFMIFESKNKNIQHKVTVNADQSIKQVENTKFLGVYIEKTCVRNFTFDLIMFH